MYTVSSEIYKETDYQPIKGTEGKVVSNFKFHYPEEKDDDCVQPGATTDKDGDLLVHRRAKPKIGQIELEHSEATELKLVGLQVWRGALLLADFLFARRHELHEMQLLELGAGVGLTSIAGGVYARKVICTDVNLGCILQLIRGNMLRNARLLRDKVEVLEFNFLQPATQYSQQLFEAIDASDIVLAADVIYDDELTNAFIGVIDAIFARQIVSGRRKIIYVALEKRYVFTLAECDSVAPMYEFFIKQTMNKPWHFNYLPLDFPQYFEYERCKELVLIELTSNF